MKKSIRLLLPLALVLAALLALCACDGDPLIGGDPNSKDKVEKFVVTFDSAGGSPVDSVQVEDGDKVKRPTDPVRAGYEFCGWVTGGEVWSFVGYVVTEDMTLVAEWREIESTEGLEFAETNGGTYAVTGYTGTCADVVIQPYYKGVPVTEIRGGALTSLTAEGASVSIPPSIKKIEPEAFHVSASPRRINITDIAAWCSIDFSEWNHFSEWSLYLDGTLVTDLVIPKGTGTTGNYAFYGCESITSLTLEEGVGEVGYASFSLCRNLERVVLAADTRLVSVFAFTECTSLADVTLGGVTELAQSAFRSCTALRSIVIPSTVTRLGRGLFIGCTALESITFTDPNGWYITKRLGYEDGTPYDLSDPVANVDVFTKTETMRYFYREIAVAWG